MRNQGSTVRVSWPDASGDRAEGFNLIDHCHPPRSVAIAVIANELVRVVTSPPRLPAFRHSAQDCYARAAYAPVKQRVQRADNCRSTARFRASSSSGRASVKDQCPPISADLRRPRWVRFGAMKSRSRCESGRLPLGNIGRGPARGACRGARVVLRLREPNLRPGWPAQLWPRPAVSPQSLPPMLSAIPG